MRRVREASSGNSGSVNSEIKSIVRSAQNKRSDPNFPDQTFHLNNSLHVDNHIRTGNMGDKAGMGNNSRRGVLLRKKMVQRQDQTEMAGQETAVGHRVIRLDNGMVGQLGNSPDNSMESSFLNILIKIYANAPGREHVSLVFIL